MSKRILGALLLLLACEPASITVYRTGAAGGQGPDIPTAGSGGSVAGSGGEGGAMGGNGGEAVTVAGGGQGGAAGMGGAGAGGDGLPVECLVAPPGHCGGGELAFGWVCWGGAPHPGCEPAAEQVPQAGAETWCCSESCAPQPYYDASCANCYPATPRYYNCYQDLAELPGCESFGSYAVCCP